MPSHNPIALEPLEHYGALLGRCAGTVAGCTVYFVVICVALLSHYLGETFTVLPLLLAALLNASAPRQDKAGRQPVLECGGKCTDELTSSGEKIPHPSPSCEIIVHIKPVPPPLGDALVHADGPGGDCLSSGKLLPVQYCPSVPVHQEEHRSSELALPGDEGCGAGLSARNSPVMTERPVVEALLRMEPMLESKFRLRNEHLYQLTESQQIYPPPAKAAAASVPPKRRVFVALDPTRGGQPVAVKEVYFHVNPAHYRYDDCCGDDDSAPCAGGAGTRAAWISYEDLPSEAYRELLGFAAVAGVPASNMQELLSFNVQALPSWPRDGAMCLYIISPFCNGGALEQWLRQWRGQLDPLLVSDLLLQVARVLAAMAAQGLCYGDLKPLNIWLRRRAGGADGRWEAVLGDWESVLQLNGPAATSAPPPPLLHSPCSGTDGSDGCSSSSSDECGGNDRCSCSSGSGSDAAAAGSGRDTSCSGAGEEHLLRGVSRGSGSVYTTAYTAPLEAMLDGVRNRDYSSLDPVMESWYDLSAEEKQDVMGPGITPETMFSHVTCRTDVYAFGKTLEECMAACCFGGSGGEEGDPPALAGLQRALRALCEACCQTVPRQRLPMAHVVARLAQALYN